jgi:hypothetical protein
MAGDDKKTAPKARAKEKAKDKAEVTGKPESKPDAKTAAKTDAKPEAAAPSNYSRGEGQKPVSQAYKDNWNAIFGKKSNKKSKKKKR